jgi:hypothetical protein
MSDPAQDCQFSLPDQTFDWRVPDSFDNPRTKNRVPGARSFVKSKEDVNKA